jgi:hypothetical protein
MRSRLLRRFAMVVAAALVGLTTMLVPAGRAWGDGDGAVAAAETSSRSARRLIRIGPQALVAADENGRLSMVDEDVPQRTRETTLGILLGAMVSIAAAPLALPLNGATPVR